MDEVYEQHSRLLPGAVWSLCNEDKSPYAWTDYVSFYFLRRNFKIKIKLVYIIER